MRKHILTLLLLGVSLFMAAKKEREIVLLHTNDTHSCILPLRQSPQKPELADKGGFLRRLEMIGQERKKAPSLLLFDSGDFSQGSPYFTLFQGKVEVGLMNFMGYDAATIGNHEFDFGLDGLASMIRQARFPFVCANYDFTGTPVEGLTKEYIVLKREGIRIGVFGLSPKMDGLVTAQNCAGVKYLDPLETAQRMVRTLRQKERCGVVICLSHLGWQTGEEDDNHLIEATDGIDLVLGGHSHTYFPTLKYVKNNKRQAVPVDQNGKNAAYVGKITIRLK